MRAKRLTIQQRKEIFHTLVQTQDLGLMSNGEAMEHVGKLYKIDLNQLQTIVDEGIEKDWLDEEFVTVP
jgi:hypothetical protein